MILITQRLAGCLRTAFRQALNLPTRGPMPPVHLCGSADGLRIRCRMPQAAAEFHLAGKQPTEELWVPFELLSDVEGRKDSPVEIRQDEGQVLVSWRDGSVPQMIQHPAPPAEVKDWPPSPKRFAENPPALLKALAEACQTTDPNSSRYALGCFQVRSGGGKIVATDGHQLLVQSGFTFPWEGDILVPVNRVFASAQIPADQPVFLGKTEKWLTLCVGTWTFHLALDTEGRFPKAEDCIGRAEYSQASAEIPTTDRQFLLENLLRLPADAEYNYPVTVDLNGSVSVRARAQGQTTPTELILSNSSRAGEPIRLNTNRRYLHRAIALGFERLYLFGPRAPVLCQDEHRQYVWMPLDPDAAVKPADDAVRIASPAEPAHPAVTQSPQPRRRTPQTMPRKTPDSAPESAASQNGHSHKPAAEQSPPEEPGSALAQAIALRDALREAAGKAGELIQTLKRERKQSKLLKTTLASLREIQSLEV